MASIVTSRLAPSGLPKEAGYTTGFAVMTVGLLLAALAGLLIPAARGGRGTGGEPRRAGVPVTPGEAMAPDYASD